METAHPTRFTLPPHLLRVVDTESIEFLELEGSIRAHGILKPVLVREKRDRLELIDGLHRFTAAQRLGREIPYHLIEADDDLALLLSIQSNAISAQMAPCDYATHLRRYLNKHPEITMADLGQAIHKSPVWISQALILDSLNAATKTRVNRGDISLANAYLLAKIPPHGRGEYIDRACVMTAADFRIIATDAARRYREEVRTGRLSTAYPTQFSPRPRLRALSVLKEELETWIAATTSLDAQECRTPLDGWKAALRWAMQLDPAGLRAQRELYESYQRPLPDADLLNSEESITE